MTHPEDVPVQRVPKAPPSNSVCFQMSNEDLFFSFSATALKETLCNHLNTYTSAAAFNVLY